MDDKYAKRIADLLRMAESGDDAEAQAALEQAERLMTRYGIDHAVAMAAGEQRDETIVEKYMSLDGIYSRAIVIGFNGLGSVINVKVLNVPVPRTKRIRVLVIGYESDVDNAITLFTSLMLQAVNSATKAYKLEGYLKKYGTASEKFNFRRSHVVGFFHGARARIESTRLQVFTETTGSEIAVRERMTAVDEWVDNAYGELRSGRGISVNYGYHDGYEAGQHAMAGEPALKQRGQICG